MEKLNKFLETIRESEAYQQVKVKYDELDSQAKLYINLGAVALVALMVLLSFFVWMARLDGMKADLTAKEELIGYLHRSADTIHRLKQERRIPQLVQSPSASLTDLINAVVGSSGIDPTKIKVGNEQAGKKKQSLVGVKMSQVNLRQVVRLLYSLTEQGRAHGLNVEDLDIDTKGDMSGYIDVNFTVAAYFGGNK